MWLRYLMYFCVAPFVTSKEMGAKHKETDTEKFQHTVFDYVCTSKNKSINTSEIAATEISIPQIDFHEI